MADIKALMQKLEQVKSEAKAQQVITQSDIPPEPEPKTKLQYQIEVHKKFRTKVEEYQAWVKSLPPGYTIRRTPEGYEAVPPPEGTREKELFYSMEPGEQHLAEMAAPAAQLVKGVGGVFSWFTGGAVEVHPTGEKPLWGGEYTGRSVFIHGGSVAPTLFDVMPWAPGWRQEWIRQRVKESPFSLVTMGVGEAPVLLGMGKFFRGTSKITKSFIGKTYVKTYPHFPKIVKQFRHGLKSRIATTKFKIARITGRGMFKEKELISYYRPGRWREIPYSIVTKTSYPLREPRILITRTGEFIPLESYRPVLPGPGGRIVDVGRMPSRPPQLAIYPKKWYFESKDAILYASKKPVFSSMFKKIDMFKISKHVEIPPKGLITKQSLKVVSFKKAKISDYFPRTRGPSLMGVSDKTVRGFRMPDMWAIATGGVSLEFLEFLEEGTQYVHPRWAKISTGLKISTSALEFERISAITPVIISDVRKIPGITHDIKKAQLPMISSAMIQAQAQLQVQLQRQELVTITDFKTPLKFREKFFSIEEISFLPLEELPRPPLPSPILLPSKKETKKPRKQPQGYDVFIKDIQYKHGKKRYPTQFIKVSKKPMTRHDALSFGGEVVDQSAAATFKIKPSPTPKTGRGRRVYKPPFRVRSWDILRGKFYQKKDQSFVERNLFRIDTSGEVRGISAKGWIAQKTKKPKKKKTKKRRKHG